MRAHNEQLKNTYKTELSDAATSKILQLQAEIQALEAEYAECERENKELKIASLEGVDITKVINLTRFKLYRPCRICRKKEMSSIPS